MNTTDAIELKKAEAKFTRSKEAVDGSAKKEAAYQKAKRSLAQLRISLRGHTPHNTEGDATAKPSTLKAKAKKPVSKK